MQSISPWVPLIREAGLTRSASKFIPFTFCTVSRDNRPKARTCVFRGWLFDDPSTGVLEFTTDIRMNKVDDLQNSDLFESVFYFPDTRMQFRISGFCQMISSNTFPSLISRSPLSPIGSPRSSTFNGPSSGSSTNENSNSNSDASLYPICSPSKSEDELKNLAKSGQFPSPTEQEWTTEYDRLWDALSSNMKSTFKKPPPGTTLNEESRKAIDSISRGADGLSENEGKSNFVVMLMFPNSVDMVNLHDGGQRSLFDRVNYDEWTEEEVCP